MRSVHRLCLDVVGARDIELTATQLSFASSDEIRERAPKQVTKAETLDFKTLTPERGGLFDYRVFGPGTVIDAAPVGDDEAVKPTKTQCARVSLALPIVHPLVVAHAADEVIERAGVTRDALEWNSDTTPGQYANLVDALELAGHGTLVMRELPVLPPDLRPLRRLDDDRWAISPINDAYRRVIHRNERLAKVIEQNAPAVIVAGERRQLHDAILHLFDSDTSLRAVCGGGAGFVDSIHALDRAAGMELTGRLYRVQTVLFALGVATTRRAG